MPAAPLIGSEPGVQGAQPPLAARPPYRAADDADPGRERGAPAADGLASTEARARLDEALARSRPESRQPESKHAVAAAEPNGPADGAQPGRLDFGPLLAQDVSLWGEPDEPDLFH